jgi:eukaryotic-like serine/threonine-protein kinase
MPKLDQDRWNAVSPLLDRAIELTSEDRAKWLDSLHTLSPTLAFDLAAVLEQRGIVLEERFLEAGPALPAVLDGQRIGAYTLVSRIGEGGMGTIWLARRSDGRYEGQVAVKLLNAHLVGRQGERFEREGSILARLSDPHIAHLVDAGVTPAGQPYLVLEYVEGEHINRYCETRSLGVEARVRLFLDVLDAVAHAHANLIVHRDLKPSNILVRNDGQVKLLDFGIAKLLEGDGMAEATALTREGGAMLTPAYAAPEQMTGGTITTATDVYALGVVLYELLSGRHPAGGTGRSPGELFKAVVETEPPRLSTVAARPSARTLRGDLDTIVAKALKKNPQERYASVAALAEDLRRYLAHQPIAARRDRVAYRAARFVRRHRLPVAMAALALVALVAGLVGTLWQAREARRQRDLALSQLARAQGINEFTEFLLGEGIPDNRPVSVRELLQRSEALIESRFADDEALSVDLLVSVGDVYGSRGEEEALRIWKRAYEASLRVADPAVRAHAACSWAGAVDYFGDTAGAQRLIDGALAALPRHDQYDVIAARCLIERAAIADHKKDTGATMASARQALDRLGDRPASPWHRGNAFHLLARAHDALGETGKAERAYAQSMRELERIGATNTNSGMTLLNNWALLRAVTDPLGALPMQARVVGAHGTGDSVGSQGAIDLYNYGTVLYRLARFPEARAAYERSRDAARTAKEPVDVALANRGLAATCRRLGDMRCAREGLREAAALRAHPARGYTHLAELSQEEGLQAAAAGDVERARELLSAALRIHDQEKERHASEIETRLELAKLELRLGRTDAAEQRARDALDRAERRRDEMPHSAWVGLSQLVLSDILRARGDGAAARRLLQDALVQMTSTLGEAHPAVRDARARLSGS